MAKELGNIVKGIKKLALAAAAVVVLGVSTSSFAAVLVDFKAEPNNPSIPSIKFEAGALVADAGAASNGVIDAAPGLSIETPFLLAGAGSAQNLTAGTTTFKDVSLTLSDFTAVGAPVTVAIGPNTLVTQPLSTGNFSFKSTAGDVLLAGKIEEAYISGTGKVGGVFSAKVTYESGTIYTALVDSNWKKTGELSWSLLEIDPALGTTSSPGGLVLNPFRAKVGGQFSGTPIPEPASLGLLALAGLGLAARRRTH